MNNARANRRRAQARAALNRPPLRAPSERVDPLPLYTRPVPTADEAQRPYAKYRVMRLLRDPEGLRYLLYAGCASESRAIILASACEGRCVVQDSRYRVVYSNGKLIGGAA